MSTKLCLKAVETWVKRERSWLDLKGWKFRIIRVVTVDHSPGEFFEGALLMHQCHALRMTYTDREGFTKPLELHRALVISVTLMEDEC